MDLFKKRDGDVSARKVSDEDREKKLQVLNEYLSDQFLERTAGIMGKQFTEKEQLLKLTNQKYMDQAAAETEAIKSQFAIDYEKLKELHENNPESMTVEAYVDTEKKLKVSEANMLR